MALVAAGVAAAAADGAFGQSGPSGSSSPYPTSAATVTERSLTSQTQVDGTLGNADFYTVVNQVVGTITALPPVGQVVRQGQVLYQVNAEPVLLLYGSVPAYRTISEGMTGMDVTELNHNLVNLGYADRSDIAALDWDYFGWDTQRGLAQLQAKLGTIVTGILRLGQAVFLPGAIQVSGVEQNTVLGGSATPGAPLLTATSTTPVVTIDLNPSEQTEVMDGDHVSIALPNGSTTPGIISSVGTVATTASSNNSGSLNDSGSSSATITVKVSLTDPKAADGLTQAPVTVTITSASVSNALVVPVTALLAQAGGGYAVEVTGPRGHHLVPVTTGLFDDADGLVQVTGSDLAAGQHVVVPAS